MSKSASAYKIGVFVIGGVVIAIAIVTLLGAGRLFSRRVPFILYFSDSVNGLAVGSPVKFKGVPIGNVKRISVSLSKDRATQHIPVLIEVDEYAILSETGVGVNIRDRAFVESQVQRGLRASLEIESFITSRLYVQFDFYTNAAPPRYENKEGPVIEIPTATTGLPELLKSLERVDLPGLSMRLNRVLEGMERGLQEAQISEIRRKLLSALDAFEKLAEAPEVKSALNSLTQTSEEARKFFAEVRVEVKPVAGSLTNITGQVVQALGEMRTTTEELRRILAPDSPLLGDVTSALQEFSDTARSLRRLAEYLNRNPRALITGRPSPETKP